MASSLYQSVMKRLGPPWLRRLVGQRLQGSIGQVIDTHVDRLFDGLKLRFPGAGGLDALPYIGRDRLIRRGPLELDETYAARLRRWWDSHRTRGGPYALLHQLYDFWLADLGVRMDVVYYSGTRRWVDVAGEITRDSISWSADGSGKWARIWIFFYLNGVQLVTDTGALLVTDTGEGLIADGPSTYIFVDELITDTGAELITDTGASLIADTLYSGSVTDADAEMLKLIPREWNAAHIDKTTVVLLFGAGRLWDYPVPVPLWNAGGTYQTTNPIQLEA